MPFDARCCIEGETAGEIGTRATSSISVCLLTAPARRELGEFAGVEPGRGDARAVVVAGEKPVRARKEAAWTARRMARAMEGMVFDVLEKRCWAGEVWICASAEDEGDGEDGGGSRERVVCLNRDPRRLLYAEFETVRSHASRLNVCHVIVTP